MSAAIEARDELQKYTDSLFGEFGLTLYVDFQDGSQNLRNYLGGVRVLRATPIYDRSNGSIQNFRYLMMFVDQGVIDLVNAGNPVHVFECEVTKQMVQSCWLREVDGPLAFLLSKNDPHSLFEEQAAIYTQWDQELARFGGQEKLDQRLDELAARQLKDWEWHERHNQ